MKGLVKKIVIGMVGIGVLVGIAVGAMVYAKADESDSNYAVSKYSEDCIIQQAEDVCNALINKDSDRFVKMLDEEIKNQIINLYNLKNDEEIMMSVYNTVFPENVSKKIENLELVENTDDRIEVIFCVKDDTKYYKWNIDFNKELKIIGLTFGKTIPIAKESEYYKEYNIKVGAYKLEGVLNIPKGVNNPAVAILVPGSGYSDADCGNKFRYIASDLAEKGIATLRFNERFYENRKLSFTNNTIYTESIDDVCDAVDMLKKDNRVSADNIFIIGHSLGGMLAPKIAELKPEVKGIISLAGSPRKLVDILEDQYKMICDEMNASDEERKFFDDVICDIKNITSESDDMSGAEIKDTMTDEEIENIKNYRIYRMYSDTYWLSCHGLNTEEILSNLSIPMLILQGEKDVNVFADKDYVEWKRVLKYRENCYFKLYPELNHLFTKQVYPGILNRDKDYSLQGRIDRNVTSDIAEFIKKYTYK